MGLLDKLSSWLGRERRTVSVLVLGLDNAGKSTVLNTLRPQEQRQAHVTPTVGQRQDTFRGGGVSFSAWDMSGAGRHRALWERHYRDADAFIFVVDATDRLRMVVARDELALMLSHPEVVGRRAPLLVLANKCDSADALGAAAVCAALGLSSEESRPWHVAATCATSGAGLEEGVGWLASQLHGSRAY